MEYTDQEICPPLVTVVTPAFNQGRFILYTVDSVLSQDYPKSDPVSLDSGLDHNPVQGGWVWIDRHRNHRRTPRRLVTRHRSCQSGGVRNERRSWCCGCSGANRWTPSPERATCRPMNWRAGSGHSSKPAPKG